MSVHKEVAISISKSGKTAQEWMREAAQIRLEQEKSKAQHFEALKGQMKSLQHYVNELTAEIKTLKTTRPKTILRRWAWIAICGTLGETVCFRSPKSDRIDACAQSNG